MDNLIDGKAVAANKAADLTDAEIERAITEIRKAIREGTPVPAGWLQPGALIPGLQTRDVPEDYWTPRRALGVEEKGTGARPNERDAAAEWPNWVE